MIATAVPYTEGEKNAYKSVSQMSGEAVLVVVVVIICVVVLFWFLRKGK